MKTETIYARVTPELAKKVQDRAATLGESDAYVMREALREYFARREINSANPVEALSDAVVSAAAPESPAIPAPLPTSYKPTRATRRHLKAAPAPGGKKKGPLA